MVKLRFVSPDGAEREIDAPEGVSVMKAATDAGIEGIIGDCGGNLSCATCHGYIAPEWRARLTDPSSLELEMLDCALDVTEDSRLTCQIVTSPELDGLTVGIPPYY